MEKEGEKDRAMVIIMAPYQKPASWFSLSLRVSTIYLLSAPKHFFFMAQVFLVKTEVNGTRESKISIHL